ncbi:MAG TPA: PTS sugar transporter subunit IIA [Phycisphaerae bacterium]|nr:PTS sugar transporter subunit IIA [Phycisphaerales bacterium]HRX86447.1 PTS sugar transporter subunit IIA [Phycisphaerae bacterium]
MKLIDFFVIDACIPELKATDRNGVIREMIESLAAAGAIAAEDTEAVARACIARENHGSTGFGKGVAVPHVKHPSVKKMAASIARSTVGIDFAALDRAPVYTVVMLLSNDQDPDKHLAAMERIFRHLQRDNFRRFLRQAETQDAMRDLIVEADEMQEN